MLLPSRLVLLSVLLSTAAVFGADSATQEWKDPKGGTFKGEPVEVIGPLALWRTGSLSSKFHPLRTLSPEDCVRFYQATAGQPPRAERWSDAKGRATSEFIGRLQRRKDGKLQPVDFSSLPEPELLIVVFASRNARDLSLMIGNLGPFVNRVRRVYPGRVATVVMSSQGGRSGQGNGVNLASLSEAWLIVDPSKQDGLKTLAHFVPQGGFVMMLMTRHGVPLYGAPAQDVTDVMHFIDGTSDMLWQLNPANPRTSRDRAHYLRAIRPVEFAQGKAEPLLLADMFRADGLRQNGIVRVEAKIDVAADGFVTAAEMLPTAELPAKIAPALAEAIRRTAQFVPAIENGTPVAGSYNYTFTVGPANPQLSADAAWINGEARVDVPLKNWLILRPVHVPEQVFGGIDRVGTDGTVMMKAVTAGDAKKVSTASQMSSFNSDWFTDSGGPSSVRPKAGDKQDVDGTKLVWKNATAIDCMVDFLVGSGSGSFDFCLGYAWTEFEISDDRDGWLGIGSDDGLKVWLNGELVNDKWMARTSRLDDDVVPVRLKKGKNQILIKIQNVKGLWGFTSRLRVKAS
jgi:hypothetical protein